MKAERRTTLERVVLVALGVAGLGFALAAAPALAAPGDSAGALADSAGVARAAPDYLAQVRENFGPESRAYWNIRNALSFGGPLYEGALMLFLLFFGVSAGMRDIADALGRNRYVRALIYVTLFSLVAAVLGFPLAWFSDFWLEHRFGLSNQSFGAWFGEQGKDLLVNVAVFGGLGLVALAYRAIARSPRRWWLWLGIGTLPVILFMTLIQPVFIEPLYNRFRPLEDKALEAKILALAERADVPGRRVLEADKSRQTKRFNAYVSGFGASQRIVLWDTIIAGMEEDELLFVMGHEMGHYKLHHIWKGIVLFSILSFALFWFAWASMTWAIGRFGRRWRVRELHDLASMPLLAFTIGVALQIAAPVRNGFSRAIEHEADVFALEVTRDNDAGARAFLALASQNRANPEPPAFVKLMRYSHPPLAERIRFALDYRPWERGAPNRAFKPSD